jgi:TatD DNase family protein
LYVREFDGDRSEALERAYEAGVGVVMLPAIDSTAHEAMFSLARADENCKPMMGVHPTSMNDNPQWRDELALVERYLAEPPEGIARFWGVGEAGIDLHWSRDFLAEQTEAFVRQAELALKYDLPLVVHARDAWDEVFEVLGGFRGRGLRGVMHAFSGGVEEYRRAREIGDFAIGITGVATYKRGPLDEVIRAVPLHDIVLETDCPYLTPEPRRGTRNESAYLPLIRDRVALLRGVTPDDVERTTTLNARRIFGF